MLTFYECLAKGNLAEEQVAQWYEEQGYKVERIGAYKLAIDLLVWNEKEEFGVQVKLRTNDPLNRQGAYFYLKAKECLAIRKIIEEDKLPVVLAVTNGKEVQITKLMIFGTDPRTSQSYGKEILPCIRSI